MTRWKRISVKDVPVPDGHIIGRDWEEVAGWGGGQIDGEDLPAPVAAKPSDSSIPSPHPRVIDGSNSF